MRGPSARPFSIAANTTKLDVDNRFPLKKYYRTADNLLKQANIYREEKNIIELYILLLRFSSLVGETIPEHQDYRTLSAKEKAEYRKKLVQVLSQLEQLKPEVQKQVDKLNHAFVDNSSTNYEWPPVPKAPIFSNNEKDYWMSISNGTSHQTFDNSTQTEQLNSLSFNLPRPKDETLSRHSFLGPNGLRARWEMPVSQARVQYPSYIDASPIEIPSLDQNWNKTVSIVELLSSVATLDPYPESVLYRESDARPSDIASQPNLIRQPSPPPVAAPVRTLPTISETMEPSKLVDHVPPWNVADPIPGPASRLGDELTKTKGPKHLHISPAMMDEFLKLAMHNTKKNLETCGVLAGSLKNAVFYVTALIIPKQQSTPDTYLGISECETVNEEEIFDCQDKRGLFQLGWIHTHPTQSCFMSSIDLHTHYSYQVMLPEAIAVVMAPTDASRPCGIFQLSDPGGVKVIQQCQLRGFHPHEEPLDGGTIYEHCGHVLMNENLRYKVIDLRQV